MHACELIELSALLASHGRILELGGATFQEDGLEEYWVASKCRLDRWGMALARHAASRDRPRAGWQTTRAVVEEIFASEVLTRVWAVLCCRRDRRNDKSRQDASAVARNVFAGHLEASGRAMRLLAQIDRISIEDAVGLNRLRRRCERWNDLLLCLHRDIPDTQEFIHCSNRIKDVALPGDRYERSVLLAAVQIGCHNRMTTRPANPASNRRVAAAVLGCLGPEAFGTCGLMHSELAARIYNSAFDTKGEVSQLLRQPAAQEGGEPQEPTLPIGTDPRNRF